MHPRLGRPHLVQAPALRLGSPSPCPPAPPPALPSAPPVSPPLGWGAAGLQGDSHQGPSVLMPVGGDRPAQALPTGPLGGPTPQHLPLLGDRAGGLRLEPPPLFRRCRPLAASSSSRSATGPASGKPTSSASAWSEVSELCPGPLPRGAGLSGVYGGGLRVKDSLPRAGTWGPCLLGAPRSNPLLRVPQILSVLYPLVTQPCYLGRTRGAGSLSAAVSWNPALPCPRVHVSPRTPGRPTFCRAPVRLTQSAAFLAVRACPPPGKTLGVGFRVPTQTRFVVKQCPQRSPSPACHLGALVTIALDIGSDQDHIAQRHPHKSWHWRAANARRTRPGGRVDGAGLPQRPSPGPFGVVPIQPGLRMQHGVLTTSHGQKVGLP